MQLIGNIILSLAAFLYVLPLQLLMHDTGRRRDDGGALWGAIFLFVPLWSLLTIALLLATSRGGFDWLPMNRGPQYLLVFLSGVALLVVTLFSFLGKVEHASQLPWAAHMFRVWAAYVFPLLAMMFAFLVLNPAVGTKVPALVYRTPFAIISVASLLACGGMIVQWIIFSQQQQLARVERAIEQDNERDRNILAEVNAMNTTNDFARLLGFANRFENEKIRQLAIEKALGHPQFMTALADVLNNYYAEKGLVYLDACDVSEGDMKTLAEPVRAAIVVLTKDAQDSVERTHTFYAEQFDWNTRIILSVADKFHGRGVDYVPAIREFRAALDAPRGKDFNFNARPTLDAWLARQTKTATGKR